MSRGTLCLALLVQSIGKVTALLIPLALLVVLITDMCVQRVSIVPVQTYTAIAGHLSDLLDCSLRTAIDGCHHYR
mgnify:CR=1 FL=1